MRAMSIVLTRSPLEPIGMNGAGASKRRSARLSGESVEENEPPAKKNRMEGAVTSVVGTKEADGDSGAVGRKKRKGKTPFRIFGADSKVFGMAKWRLRAWY